MGIWLSDLLSCKEDKLGPRARKGVFIGFKKDVKGYKIWDPKDKKFILSRDVTFNEASSQTLSRWRVR